MIARTLRMKKIPFTVLEASFEQVDFVRKFGNKIYFGDASRLDLLRAARAESADVFVLAIDDIEASIKTALMVKKTLPAPQDLRPCPQPHPCLPPHGCRRGQANP